MGAPGMGEFWIRRQLENQYRRMRRLVYEAFGAGLLFGFLVGGLAFL